MDDDPVAGPDFAPTVKNESVTIDLLANDSDAEGPVTLLYVESSSTYGGTVLDNQDGTVTYTPPLDFTGIDSFGYNIEDSTGRTVTPGGGGAAVYVTDPDNNDAPWGSFDQADTDEDTGIDIDVLANDYDPEGGLSVVSIIGCQNGTATLNQDGTIHYAPAAHFHGTDGFLYQVSDGTATAWAAVSVTVRSVNDAPVAVDDEASGTHGTPVLIGVSLNDTDVDDNPTQPKIVADVTQPAHGTVWFETDPFGGDTVYYQANLDFPSGTDTFEYTMVDGNGGSATGTVTVTVVVADFDISGMSEADEDTVGGLVVLNTDNNNAPRKNILVTVTPTTWDGKVVLTCSGGVRVFDAATGGREITFNGTDNVFDANALMWDYLYVEGSSLSSTMRDVELSIQPQGMAVTDSVKFTVLWVGMVNVAFTGDVSNDNDKREAYRNMTVSVASETSFPPW